MKVEADFPPDSVLPQLPTALDAASMQKVFQAHLFTDDEKFRVLNCAIERVKYKPGINCMICYELEIIDEVSQQRGKQLLCTRIFEAGGVISRFRKAQSEKGIPPKFGLPISHLPALEMLIWAFPNDRKLHGMHKITDPDFLKDKLLPEYLRALPGSPGNIAKLTTHVVHYVPEHTCTVRVVLKFNGSQTENKETTLYGKTYYNDDGHDVFMWMDALWQSESRRSGQLKMAQAIGYDATTKSLWQTGLCGAPLLDVDMQTPQFTSLLREAASTVGSLHATAIPGLRPVRLDDLLNQLERVKQLLSQGRPTLKLILFPLVDRLRAQSGNFGLEESATLHGDLHLNNFFVEDKKIALIDMDNLCQGPPLLDVGSFLAGIIYRGILVDAPRNQIEKMAQVFVQEYEQSVSWTVSRTSLRWYTAMMLINERAFRCMTRLKAGRLDILDHLIDLADCITLEKTGNSLIYS